jgi:mannose-6-phosphate isomerase-like protein (cupin superfamily)
MTDHPQPSPGLAPVPQCPACLPATFREAGDNPLLVASASDDRGEFFALDTAASPPGFVEIIHSRPRAVRGNHLHRRCAETLTVLSGAIDLYLLCACPGRHLYRRRMERGASVLIPPGAGHAVHALLETELIAVFTGADPRQDRERIVLIG